MAARSCWAPSIGALKRTTLPSRTVPSIQRASFSYLDILKEHNISIRDVARERGWKLKDEQMPEISKETIDTLGNSRLPRNVQAIYLAPLRRVPEYGIPVCDLQLRSYAVRNLELMTDFAMRAAYYLGLPTKGPVPLPRIVERWTVPRGNFVHKKSQENFERVTCRRLIQVQDADPEVVHIWLGYLQKRQYHGVGLKANVWQHEELGVGKKMDAETQQVLEGMNEDLENYGRTQQPDVQKRIEEILAQDHYKEALERRP